MVDSQGFYLGKQGTLYLQRQNGSLSRFGIRVTESGTIVVFDHLTRQWHELPAEIPDRSGGSITIKVERAV